MHIEIGLQQHCCKNIFLYLQKEQLQITMQLQRSTKKDAPIETPTIQPVEDGIWELR